MSNWSEEQIAEHYRRLKTSEGCSGEDCPAGRVPAEHKRKRGPNKWETEYAEILENRKRVGDIQWWAYEPLRLRLATRTTYCPDFLLVLANGSVEVHEVKGFLRDDASVKFKVAAELYPWIKFRMLRKEKNGEWDQIR